VTPIIVGFIFWGTSKQFNGVGIGLWLDIGGATGAAAVVVTAATQICPTIILMIPLVFGDYVIGNSTVISLSQYAIITELQATVVEFGKVVASCYVMVTIFLLSLLSLLLCNSLLLCSVVPVYLSAKRFLLHDRAVVERNNTVRSCSCVMRNARFFLFVNVKFVTFITPLHSMFQLCLLPSIPTVPYIPN
jgi:hypothetical protein